MVGLVLISHSGDARRGSARHGRPGRRRRRSAGASRAGPTTGAWARAPRASTAAIRSTLDAGADDVLVLLDLGSAALSLELALEELPDDRPRADPHQRGAARRGRDPRGRPGQRRRRHRRGGHGRRRGGVDGQAAAMSRAGLTWPSSPSPSSTRPGSMPGRRPASSRRPAASPARIVIRHDGREADAKSLIALLGMTIRPSSEIVLAADGPDADDALAALAAELAPYVSPARLTPSRNGGGTAHVVPDPAPRSSAPRSSAPPSSCSSVPARCR